jgi:hypothetical protein
MRKFTNLELAKNCAIRMWETTKLHSAIFKQGDFYLVTSGAKERKKVAELNLESINIFK